MINIEEWLYNMGSSRFMRTLVFRDGTLMSITLGNYGFDKGSLRKASVEKGDSRAIVTLKYGNPVAVEKHQNNKLAHIEDVKERGKK